MQIRRLNRLVLLLLTIHCLLLQESFQSVRAFNIGDSPRVQSLPVSEYRSLQSHNAPDRFVRHRDFLGELEPVTTDVDRRDATFKIVAGLADSSCVSFESLNGPTYYLRHSDFRIRLDPFTETELFRADATFCPQSGLADNSKFSFESYNGPGLYIRHRGFHLYLESGSDDIFRADATFAVVAPRVPQLPAGQYRSFESHNGPDLYFRHKNFLGELESTTTDQDRYDATFKVIAGLANSNCISFESLNLPNFFFRHSDFRIRLDAFEDTAQFRADATFCPSFGLGDESKTSFESYNFPGRYIRHRDFHLYIESGDDVIFRDDATFAVVAAQIQLMYLPMINY
jgi:hypothetical protein